MQKRKRSEGDAEHDGPDAGHQHSPHQPEAPALPNLSPEASALAVQGLDKEEEGSPPAGLREEVG